MSPGMESVSPHFKYKIENGVDILGRGCVQRHRCLDRHKTFITSLRQVRPLCRESGHTSRGGHKIKKGDVLPQSWSYLVISGHKAIKQKLLSNHHLTPL